MKPNTLPYRRGFYRMSRRVLAAGFSSVLALSPAAEIASAAGLVTEKSGGEPIQEDYYQDSDGMWVNQFDPNDVLSPDKYDSQFSPPGTQGSRDNGLNSGQGEIERQSSSQGGAISSGNINKGGLKRLERKEESRETAGAEGEEKGSPEADPKLEGAPAKDVSDAPQSQTPQEQDPRNSEEQQENFRQNIENAGKQLNGFQESVQSQSDDGDSEDPAGQDGPDGGNNIDGARVGRVFDQSQQKDDANLPSALNLWGLLSGPQAKTADAPAKTPGASGDFSAKSIPPAAQRRHYDVVSQVPEIAAIKRTGANSGETPAIKGSEFFSGATRAATKTTLNAAAADPLSATNSMLLLASAAGLGPSVTPGFIASSAFQAARRLSPGQERSNAAKRPASPLKQRAAQNQIYDGAVKRSETLPEKSVPAGLQSDISETAQSLLQIHARAALAALGNPLLPAAVARITNQSKMQMLLERERLANAGTAAELHFLSRFIEEQRKLLAKYPPQAYGYEKQLGDIKTLEEIREKLKGGDSRLPKLLFEHLKTYKRPSKGAEADLGLPGRLLAMWTVREEGYLKEAQLYDTVKRADLEGEVNRREGRLEQDLQYTVALLRGYAHGNILPNDLKGPLGERLRREFPEGWLSLEKLRESLEGISAGIAQRQGLKTPARLLDYARIGPLENTLFRVDSLLNSVDDPTLSQKRMVELLDFLDGLPMRQASSTSPLPFVNTTTHSYYLASDSAGRRRLLRDLGLSPEKQAAFEKGLGEAPKRAEFLKAARSAGLLVYSPEDFGIRKMERPGAQQQARQYLSEQLRWFEELLQLSEEDSRQLPWGLQNFRAQALGGSPAAMGPPKFLSPWVGAEQTGGPTGFLAPDPNNPNGPVRNIMPGPNPAGLKPAEREALRELVARFDGKASVAEIRKELDQTAVRFEGLSKDSGSFKRLLDFINSYQTYAVSQQLDVLRERFDGLRLAALKDLGQDPGAAASINLKRNELMGLRAAAKLDRSNFAGVTDIESARELDSAMKTAVSAGLLLQSHTRAHIKDLLHDGVPIRPDQLGILSGVEGFKAVTRADGALGYATINTPNAEGMRIRVETFPDHRRLIYESEPGKPVATVDLRGLRDGTLSRGLAASLAEGGTLRITPHGEGQEPITLTRAPAPETSLSPWALRGELPLGDGSTYVGTFDLDEDTLELRRKDGRLLYPEGGPIKFETLENGIPVAGEYADGKAFEILPVRVFTSRDAATKTSYSLHPSGSRDYPPHQLVYARTLEGGKAEAIVPVPDPHNPTRNIPGQFYVYKIHAADSHRDGWKTNHPYSHFPKSPDRLLIRDEGLQKFASGAFAGYIKRRKRYDHTELSIPLPFANNPGEAHSNKKEYWTAVLRFTDAKGRMIYREDFEDRRRAFSHWGGKKASAYVLKQTYDAKTGRILYYRPPRDLKIDDVIEHTYGRPYAEYRYLTMLQGERKEDRKHLFIKREFNKREGLVHNQRSPVIEYIEVHVETEGGGLKPVRRYDFSVGQQLYVEYDKVYLQKATDLQNKMKPGIPVAEWKTGSLKNEAEQVLAQARGVWSEHDDSMLAKVQTTVGDVLERVEGAWDALSGTAAHLWAEIAVRPSAYTEAGSYYIRADMADSEGNHEEAAMLRKKAARLELEGTAAANYYHRVAIDKITGSRLIRDILPDSANDELRESFLDIHYIRADKDGYAYADFNAADAIGEGYMADIGAGYIRDWKNVNPGVPWTLENLKNPDLSVKGRVFDSLMKEGLKTDGLEGGLMVAAGWTGRTSESLGKLAMIGGSFKILKLPLQGARMKALASSNLLVRGAGYGIRGVEAGVGISEQAILVAPFYGHMAHMMTHPGSVSGDARLDWLNVSSELVALGLMKRMGATHQARQRRIAQGQARLSEGRFKRMAKESGKFGLTLADELGRFGLFAMADSVLEPALGPEWSQVSSFLLVNGGLRGISHMKVASEKRSQLKDALQKALEQQAHGQRIQLARPPTANQVPRAKQSNSGVFKSAPLARLSSQEVARAEDKFLPTAQVADLIVQSLAKNGVPKSKIDNMTIVLQPSDYPSARTATYSRDSNTIHIYVKVLGANGRLLTPERIRSKDATKEELSRWKGGSRAFKLKQLKNMSDVELASLGRTPTRVFAHEAGHGLDHHTKQSTPAEWSRATDAQFHMERAHERKRRPQSMTDHLEALDAFEVAWRRYRDTPPELRAEKAGLEAQIEVMEAQIRKIRSRLSNDARARENWTAQREQRIKRVEEEIAAQKSEHREISKQLAISEQKRDRGSSDPLLSIRERTSLLWVNAERPYAKTTMKAVGGPKELQALIEWTRAKGLEVRIHENQGTLVDQLIDSVADWFGASKKNFSVTVFERQGLQRALKEASPKLREAGVPVTPDGFIRYAAQRSGPPAVREVLEGAQAKRPEHYSAPPEASSGMRLGGAERDLQGRKVSELSNDQIIDHITSKDFPRTLEKSKAPGMNKDADHIDVGEVGFTGPSKKPIGTDYVTDSVVIVARDPATRKVGIAHYNNDFNSKSLDVLFGKLSKGPVEVHLIGADGGTSYSRKNLDLVIDYLKTQNANIVSTRILGEPYREKGRTPYDPPAEGQPRQFVVEAGENGLTVKDQRVSSRVRSDQPFGIRASVAKYRLQGLGSRSNEKFDLRQAVDHSALGGREPILFPKGEIALIEAVSRANSPAERAKILAKLNPDLRYDAELSNILNTLSSVYQKIIDPVLEAAHARMDTLNVPKDSPMRAEAEALIRRSPLHLGEVEFSRRANRPLVDRIMDMENGLFVRDGPGVRFNPDALKNFDYGKSAPRTEVVDMKDYRAIGSGDQGTVYRRFEGDRAHIIKEFDKINDYFERHDVRMKDGKLDKTGDVLQVGREDLIDMVRMRDQAAQQAILNPLIGYDPFPSMEVVSLGKGRWGVKITYVEGMNLGEHLEWTSSGFVTEWEIVDSGGRITERNLHMADRIMALVDKVTDGLADRHTKLGSGFDDYTNFKVNERGHTVYFDPINVGIMMHQRRGIKSKDYLPEKKEESQEAPKSPPAKQSPPGKERLDPSFFTEATPIRPD